MTFRWPRPFQIIFCFLVGSLLATGISACQRQATDSSIDTSIDSQPTACHWVEHVAGKTCVPDQIQRLVTLDEVSFENAIALGLKPIATVENRRLDAYLTEDQLADVVDIGKSGEPSLESVLALKPDLILGLGEYYEGLYEQTTQIAPTVLLPFDHSGLWKEVFQTYAQAIDREEKGQQVMDAYQSRTQDFQQRLAALNPLDSASFKVSVVRIYPDTINLYFRESFPGTVLQDAGLSRPNFQDISASEAQRRYQNPIQASISLESLDQVDADALFIWTAESTAESEQTAQQKLAELQANPLWKSLKVVQENKVYFVPGYWIGSGPLAANAILDDLFKYLVEKA
ncbi:MAG: iron-siderophore ABC transporter substrate-binding protein [Phormidesmis sp. RL_2_1]|nr:iron-siderophore ABC transporter substrate-binding protein [Phormidesmis sp. RL_2_1]